MRKIVFIFWVAIAGAIITIFLTTTSSNSQALESLLSPLSDLMTKETSVLASTEQLWQPKEHNKKTSLIPQPELGARVILSYDLTTDTVLFERQIHDRIPIASLTKIMTAIVALESMQIDERLTVSKYAAEIGENSMGLSENEKLKLEDLLYGLFLMSGNDATEVIAEESPFGREGFVHLMNEKAESLGLSDTHFTNPSGLEGDGQQYSSAYDLLVMTRYGLLNDTFRKIAATVEHEIPDNAYHKYYMLYNETNLLTSYPGVKGVKTGYTNEAGMCLISYLEYGGHQIIGIVMNSPNRRDEMKLLLDYSLQSLGVTPPPHI